MILDHKTLLQVFRGQIREIILQLEPQVEFFKTGMSKNKRL